MEESKQKWGEICNLTIYAGIIFFQSSMSGRTTEYLRSVMVSEGVSTETPFGKAMIEPIP